MVKELREAIDNLIIKDDNDFCMGCFNEIPYCDATYWYSGLPYCRFCYIKIWRVTYNNNPKIREWERSDSQEVQL